MKRLALEEEPSSNQCVERTTFLGFSLQTGTEAAT